MPATIISDTSCLILLDKINELHLLEKLFGTIITTQKVAEEFGSSLPQWIHIRNPQDKKHIIILEESLDTGEASAIALALETEDCLLIIDEYKGRKLATKLGLQITGTLGVIAQAKLAGHINSVKPIIDKIRATNFRISEQLELALLEQAGEDNS
jgi:predicted nucleic acid-binding protein